MVHMVGHTASARGATRSSNPLQLLPHVLLLGYCAPLISGQRQRRWRGGSHKHTHPHALFRCHSFKPRLASAWMPRTTCEPWGLVAACPRTYTLLRLMLFPSTCLHMAAPESACDTPPHPALPPRYVVDASRNRVQKFDSSGTFQWGSGSFGTGNGQVRRSCAMNARPIPSHAPTCDTSAYMGARPGYWSGCTTLWRHVAGRSMGLQGSLRLPAAPLTPLFRPNPPAVIRLQFTQAYSCAVSGTSVYGGQPGSRSAASHGPLQHSLDARPGWSAALLLVIAPGDAKLLPCCGLTPCSERWRWESSPAAVHGNGRFPEQFHPPRQRSRNEPDLCGRWLAVRFPVRFARAPSCCRSRLLRDVATRMLSLLHSRRQTTASSAEACSCLHHHSLARCMPAGFPYKLWCSWMLMAPCLPRSAASPQASLPWALRWSSLLVCSLRW